MNRMPKFGRLGENLYYGQGYSGHGVAMANMGGHLIAEAIKGQADGFDCLDRKSTRLNSSHGYISYAVFCLKKKKKKKNQNKKKKEKNSNVALS